MLNLKIKKKILKKIRLPNPSKNLFLTLLLILKKIKILSIREKIASNYIKAKINQALKANDLEKAKATMASIRKLRQAGLEQGGEHSVENLAFKLLRARGQIDKLRKYIDKLESASLSIGEKHES